MHLAIPGTSQKPGPKGPGSMEKVLHNSIQGLAIRLAGAWSLVTKTEKKIKHIDYDVEIEK